MTTTHSLELLLIEDNPGDAKLIQEVLSTSKIVKKINVVVDGEEALKFLNNEGSYLDSTTPDLILLDLNLPRKDGREVLKDIKTSSDLKHIPVVVLTTSKDEIDVLKSYELQANSFVTKPVDIDKFTNIVQTIEDFWFSFVKLPKQ